MFLALLTASVGSSAKQNLSRFMLRCIWGIRGHGFLTVVLVARWVILGLIVLRYDLITVPYIQQLIALYKPLPYALASSIALPWGIPLAYGLYLGALTGVRLYKRSWYTSHLSKRVQVFVDLFFITTIFLFRHNIKSDIYLFYLIPFIVAARYLTTWDNILMVAIFFLGMIMVSIAWSDPTQSFLPPPFQAPARYGIVLSILLLRFFLADYVRLLDSLQTTSGRIRFERIPALVNYLHLLDSLHPPPVIKPVLLRAGGADNGSGIGGALHVHTAQDNIWQEIVVRVYELLNCEHVALFLLRAGKAQVVATYGASVALPDECYSPGEGWTGQALCADVTTHRLTGQVIVDNQADTNPSINTDNRIAYTRALPSGMVQHIVVAPIIGTYATLGLLRIVNKRDSTRKSSLDLHGFTPMDVEALQMHTVQAARIIEHQHHTDRLNKLGQISTTLVSLQSRDEIITHMVMEANALFAAEDCTIFETDKSGTKLKMIGSSTIPISDFPFWTRSVSADSHVGLSAYVAATGETLNFKDDDYIRHPAYSGITSHYKYLTSKKCYSMLLVPLRDSENKCVGVMRFMNRGGPDRYGFFSAEDATTAHILASEFTNALRREYHFLRKNAQFRLQASMLPLLQSVVTHTDNTSAALTQLANTARDALKAEMVCILPMTADQSDFRLPLVAYSSGRVSETPVKRPREGGLTERLIRGVSPWLAISDITIEGNCSPFFEDEAVRGLLGVRLTFDNQLLGVLWVCDRVPRDFLEIEVAQARTIALVAALALRAADKEMVKTRQILLLPQIYRLRQLALQPDYPDTALCDAIVSVVRDACGFDTVSVRLGEALMPGKPDCTLVYEELRGANNVVLGVIDAGMVNRTYSTIGVAERTALEVLAQHLGLILEERKSLASLAAQTAYLMHFTHNLREPMLRANEHIGNVLNGVVLNPQEQITRLKIAYDGLNQLGEVVKRMLRFSWLEDIGLHLQQTDLVVVVEEALAKYYEPAHSKGVNLHCPNDGIELPPVHVDPAFIADILDNLISNALRFTNAGDSIIVSYACSAAMIRIEVRDSGRGMTADEQEKVFEKYYRSPITQNRQDGGMGLGLYYARRFAVAHGGYIDLKSTLNVGSCFILVLPIQQQSSGEDG